MKILDIGISAELKNATEQATDDILFSVLLASTPPDEQDTVKRILQVFAKHGVRFMTASAIIVELTELLTQDDFKKQKKGG